MLWGIGEPKGSPFLRPVCPCVPLCRAGGVVAGQGSLERICPDFGRRKKEGVWSKYLQGRALTDAKNVCRLNTGAELPAASLKSPQCGDFLPALVKGRRHWFVAMKTRNAKIPLEKRRFCTGAGTSAVPKFTRGEQNERRI